MSLCKSTGRPTDLDVAQLAKQLLENGIDYFSEREQLQHPERPYGGKSHAWLCPIFLFEQPSHGLAENALISQRYSP